MIRPDAEEQVHQPGQMMPRPKLWMLPRTVLHLRPLSIAHAFSKRHSHARDKAEHAEMTWCSRVIVAPLIFLEQFYVNSILLFAYVPVAITT